MWEDPIVAEVHRIREQIAAKHNYEVESFFADIQKRQAALGARLVSPKKQPTPSQQQTGPAVPVSDGPQLPQAGSAAER